MFRLLVGITALWSFSAWSAPVLTAVPSSFDFGTVRPGTSVSKTFTITNSGDAAGTYNRIYLFAAPFHLESTTCSRALAVNASCTVVISFSPTQAGGYSERLTFFYETGDLPKYTGAVIFGAAQ